MNIVLLGAPGSGKGTQASKISEKYNVPHISTGDIFRENIKNETAIGLLAKSYIDKGQLCPDDVTTRIVEERIKRDDCKNGYLLDGFPRTISQAVELDKVSKVNVVIDMQIDPKKLIKRITGRRICNKCGESFHIDFIGDTKVCSKCGGMLQVRADDNEETVGKRLKVYFEQTAPLIEYYEKEECLYKVNGDNKVEDVFEEIKKVLNLL